MASFSCARAFLARCFFRSYAGPALILPGKILFCERLSAARTSAGRDIVGGSGRFAADPPKGAAPGVVDNAVLAIMVAGAAGLFIGGIGTEGTA